MTVSLWLSGDKIGRPPDPMHARGEFFPAGGREAKERMARGEEPIARGASSDGLQPGGGQLRGEGGQGHDVEVRGIIVEVQGEFSLGTGERHGFGMGRLKINAPAVVKNK